MKTSSTKISIRLLKTAIASAVGAFALLAAQTTHAASGTWNISGGGDWNTSTNWNASPYPNGSTDFATINTVTAGSVINISSSVTLQKLIITSGSDMSLTASPSQTLTFSGAGTTLVSVSGAGAKTINANIALGYSNSFGAFANSSATSTLTINGSITGTNDQFSTLNPGKIVLTNASNSFTDLLIDTCEVAVSSIANHGTVSAAGTGNIRLGNVVGGAGTLTYTGGTVSTDRQVTIGGDTGTINSNGSGALTFTSGTFNIQHSRTASAILVLSGSNNGTINGVIRNNTSAVINLQKSGAGTWTLSGINTYSGTTAVTAGTLAVNGSISASATTVSGGILTGSGTTGGVTVSAGGTLAGTLHTGALTVQSGGILSPGNSPGILTASSATFLSGGKYTLQLNNDGSSGSAGTNWDQVAITGTLDLSGLSSSNQFVLTLQTLNGSNNPSPLAPFDASVNHTWTSIITTGGLTLPGGGFNSNLFNVDTTGFQNSFTGTFSVIRDVGNSNNLDLVYTAVPEPSTFAMALGSFGILLGLQKLRRRRGTN